MIRHYSNSFNIFKIWLNKQQFKNFDGIKMLTFLFLEYENSHFVLTLIQSSLIRTTKTSIPSAI